MKKAHIIAHTHWDREWYMPFEKHRYRLVGLIDDLIELFSKDDKYQSFHLDGHTLLIEDYLQIKPYMKEKIKELVAQHKLIIGPWYVLQDAFLTSGEANVRNLLIGRKICDELGGICKIGYFPDTFGNIGQSAQLLKQAGIDSAVFGRGVKATGFNNAVINDYQSLFSEMYWQSPDGSRVLAILFANWYTNGKEIPIDVDEAREYWDKKLADAERYASTDQYLFMNGSDHQPVQKDLTAAIKTANELYGDIEFVHSDFENYIESVKKNASRELNTVTGELRSQKTDGWHTLVNTASSRVNIKQENQKVQTYLEKIAEPLSVFAYMLGKEYPRDILRYAWKTLMQNHPHDSICGCSVDDVHSEMLIRFKKSYAAAEAAAKESLEYITDMIDTSVYERYGAEAVPFAVFNSSAHQRSDSVIVELDIAKLSVRESLEPLKLLDTEDLIVVDESNTIVPFEFEDMGIGFGYTLPGDSFRKPYMARRMKVKLYPGTVPAFGYKTFALIRDKSRPPVREAIINVNTIENQFFIITINNDGSFDLLDKRNGMEYKKLGYYEDSGDIGNEYIYKSAEDHEPVISVDIPADSISISHDALGSACTIITGLSVPKAADTALRDEMNNFVRVTNRKAGRSAEYTTLRIKTEIILENEQPLIKIRSSLENTAEDHRLRMLFQTHINTGIHRADSVFEVAERPNTPDAGWKNPSNCQHMQTYVNVCSENGGLTVGAKGLNEYEILKDDNTIAITLMRCVGEMGDWGVFPAPDAQMPGKQAFELVLIPHTGNSRYASFNLAYQSQIPWVTAQCGIHRGTLPTAFSFIRYDSERLAHTACKLGEDSDDLILRFFNMSGEKSYMDIHDVYGFDTLYQSNIVEEKLASINERRIYAEKAQIITIGACPIISESGE